MAHHRILFSIVESPTHPDLSALYAGLGIVEQRFHSMRKALSGLKQQTPDYVVAEFFYGYGNNYAGVNVSNLDVFLHSLQKYAPAARVIVLVDKAELQFVDKLAQQFSLYGVLPQPVDASAVEALLKSANA